MIFQTKDIWTRPILPVWAVGTVLAVCFFCFVTSCILRGGRGKEMVFKSIRILVALILVFIITLRPMHAGDQADLETRNLDILFVVDTTISMWAQDYNGTQERIEGVKADCAYIMEQLAGANFALIRFDNRAQILTPFTQDVRNVTDAFDTIRSPDRDYALGSDLSAPYSKMEELLRSSEQKEDRRTILFFVSDGEITNGAVLTPYTGLAHYLDSGAVLGYGTAEGGRMRESGYTSYVYDAGTGQAAVSKIDENNLRQIAKDLGIDYLYMDRPDRVDAVIAYARQIARTTVSEAKIETFDDTYFYYAAPLLCILLFLLVRQVTKRKL